WVDTDIATWALGVALGVFPTTTTFSQVGGIVDGLGHPFTDVTLTLDRGGRSPALAFSTTTAAARGTAGQMSWSFIPDADVLPPAPAHEPGRTLRSPLCV